MMVRRSWKSFLASMALVGGMTAANTAFAYDGCGAPGCGDCQQCEQIFADAGQKLTDQLAGMSCCCEPSSCCAPTSVCDPACAESCGDLLSDACGESCGEGCGESAEGCGLFGDLGCGITFGGWTQFGYQNGPDGAFTG